MRSKVVKVSITAVLALFIAGGAGTLTPKKAAACYPAATCYNTKVPKSYTLIYKNKDKRLGTIIGGAAIGGVGFIPGGQWGIVSFVAGTLQTVKDTYKGYNSYKVYVKKSDKKGYNKKIKTVFYKDINFKGKTKTRYQYK
ncbi:hypothetical protein IHV12_04145 [Fictibacillus sp. 7GRE50]|uniref:hypothetical protein n=1 Tax=Fictibacillus sp. 7GRE50 TaxID=2745878 RepID=UPI0018CD3ACF|nr:hypothetical protein [Fictibacillus sp. 7GRE50]MBH0164091.1 hypothetical protein [Fictibacillus sp. 7GRE50]